MKKLYNLRKLRTKISNY